MASSMTPSEKGGVAGKISRAVVRATVVKPTDAVVKALSRTGVLTDDGAKASPAYVKGQLKARKDTVGYAKGGAVKASPPKAYDAVKDEPTSRPLTADQMRNLRNRMKAPKRAYDPVKDEPTSRPFAKGGYAKKDMAQDKATAGKAVHKHERKMHPGKPLTKMQMGGKVGC
jgi:hypothetical protein